MMPASLIEIRRILIYSIYIFVVKGSINLTVKSNTSRCPGSSINISCVVDPQTSAVYIKKPNGSAVVSCTAPLDAKTVCIPIGPYGIVVNKVGNTTTFILTISSLNKSIHNGLWKCTQGNVSNTTMISVTTPITAPGRSPTISVFHQSGGSVSNVTIKGHVYCQNSKLASELLYANQNGVYTVLEPQPPWSETDAGNNGCDPGENNRTYTTTVTREMSALKGKTVTFKIRFNQTECASSFTTNSSSILFFPDPPNTNKTIIKGIGNSLSMTEGESVNLQCEVTGGVPLAKITWNCLSGTVTNTSIDGIARSNITFTATSLKNGQFCTCSATHPVVDITNTSVQIRVTYSPKAVNFKPADQSYTLNKSESLGPIECYADCHPNCTYKWIGPISTFTSRLYITNIMKQDAGRYNCTATNKLGTKSSGNVIVGVNYGPEKVSLQPPNSSYTINENQFLGTILCSADCKPNCSYTWNGPGTFNILNQTLKRDNIKRHQSGIYNCTATNILGSKYSQNIMVHVSYAANITSMAISEKNFTISEHSTPTITCLAEGYPLPSITLRHMGNNTIQASTSGVRLEYKLPYARCEDTGQYQCEAENNLNEITAIIIKDLNVLCAPRRIDKTKQNMAYASGGTLNITTMYLANPEPEFIWYFRNKQSHNESVLRNFIDRIEINNTFQYQNDIFRHLSLLIRRRLDEQDFGTYIIEAKNVVNYSIDSFIIAPEGKPNKPSDVHANCTNYQSAFLTWTSDYDNGHTQSFHIYYDTGEDSKKLENIADPGHHETVTKEINNLKEASVYTFKIVAKNKFGESSSSEVNCTSSHQKPQSMLAAAIAGGFGSAAIIIILIIVVVFVLRRLKHFPSKKGREKEINGRSSLTTRNDDENDEDEMRINELYVSAGPSFVKAGSANGPGSERGPGNKDVVYAVVQKHKDINAKPIDPSATYAIVDQSKKAGKGRRNRKQKAETPTPQVYENMEMTKATGGKRKGPKTSGEKNKDGLIYIDLDLQPPQTVGSRFVIHGEENRTNYLEVDLTKRADPLPPEDETKNTKDEV